MPSYNPYVTDYPGGSSPKDQFQNLYPGGSIGTPASDSDGGRRTPAANVGALLAGTMSAPEVDPRAGRRALEMLARAFREIGALKVDVGKLKQQV